MISSLAGTAALALAWAIVFISMFSSSAVTYPGLVIIFLLFALVLFAPLAIHGGLSFSVLLSGAISKEEISRSQLIMFLVLGIVYSALAALVIALLFGQKGALGVQLCSGGLLLSQISVIYFTILEDRRKKC